jgi:hypothetical protein
MSALHSVHPEDPNSQAQTSTNAAGTNKRNKIARQSIEGHLLSLVFFGAGDSGTDVTMTFDATKVPGAEKLTGMAAQLFAYGVGAVLQGAYAGVKDSDARMKAAQDKWGEIVAGHWSPGPSYREPEPDALALAVCEYRNGKGLTFHGAPLTPDTFEAFVATYMERTGIKSVAAAKRAIGADKGVAAIRARILADRARALGKSAAKAVETPSLLDGSF